MAGKRLNDPLGSGDSHALAVAQALDEVARAEARAEAARARADELSREMVGPVETTGESQNDIKQSSPRRLRLPRLSLRRPGSQSLAAAAAVVLIVAALSVSGYVQWYHWRTVDERQRTAEFAAAARQGVIMLMSIDAGKPRTDLQRLIDDTTGQFKNQMLVTANDLAEQVEKSKLSTKATVQAVAVESMTRDSAVVLVTAKSEAVDADTTKPPPQFWRLVMTMQRDGGQIKIAKLEYVR